jgi:hypothetical protein
VLCAEAQNRREFIGERSLVARDQAQFDCMIRPASEHTPDEGFFGAQEPVRGLAAKIAIFDRARADVFAVCADTCRLARLVGARLPQNRADFSLLKRTQDARKAPNAAAVPFRACCGGFEEVEGLASIGLLDYSLRALPYLFGAGKSGIDAKTAQERTAQVRMKLRFDLRPHCIAAANEQRVELPAHESTVKL